MTHGRIGRTVVLCLLTAIAVVPSAASAQVLRLAELTTEQIRALNRDRTIVIMSGA
jgi:hypothetical protein